MLFIFLLSVYLCLNTLLFGANIKIIDEYKFILKNKKLKLYIKPNEFEAIYKNGLYFSINSPDFKIKGWNFDSEPTIKHISSFKADKKVFEQPFKIELDLEFLNKDKELLRKSLKEAFICIFCFILESNGATKAKSFFVPLPQKNWIKQKNKRQVFVLNLGLSKKNKPLFKKTHFKVVNKKNISNLFNDKLLLLISIFLILFSFYFFILQKRKDYFFMFFVGVFLFSIGICLLVKACLVKNYWIFNWFLN